MSERRVLDGEILRNAAWAARKAAEDPRTASDRRPELIEAAIILECVYIDGEELAPVKGTAQKIVDRLNEQYRVTGSVGIQAAATIIEQEFVL